MERLMKETGIRSKIAKKYKATTNSKHSIPVAGNLFNREFKADKPNQKMVLGMRLVLQCLNILK
jgi:putative transposase